MRLRPLLGASALLLGLAFTALSPSARATDGPDHDHDMCARGRAFGSWELPEGGPGSASGILFRRDGTPFLGMELVLLPPAPDGGRPRIRGVLHTLPGTGTEPRVIAHVVGRFVAGEEGRGVFRAFFVRPDDDPETDSPVQVLGGIEGRFRDSRHDPDALDPGPFRARWILCRP